MTPLKKPARSGIAPKASKSDSQKADDVHSIRNLFGLVGVVDTPKRAGLFVENLLPERLLILHTFLCI